jgi:hypothetical protein
VSHLIPDSALLPKRKVVIVAWPTRLDHEEGWQPYDVYGPYDIDEAISVGMQLEERLSQDVVVYISTLVPAAMLDGVLVNRK